ncbi:MAG: hypothetical protein Q9187_009197, partial [Circinaria calcarea]
MRRASHQIFSHDRNNATPETVQNEDLNIQAVVCDNVRRARALSVTNGGLDRQRVAGIQSYANPFSQPSVRLSSTIGDESVAPDDPFTTSGPSSQRSSSIDVGAFQRSRETGKMFPAANSFPVDPSYSSSHQGHKEISSIAPTGISSNAFVFQSLDDFHFPQDNRSQPGHDPPLFVVNAPPRVGQEFGTQGEPYSAQVSPPRRLRDRNSVVQIARNAANRTSIVFNDAFNDLTNQVAQTVRRTSLARLYETAKVRQKQLQRSTVYFVFVGMPLWRGLVWWMYWVMSTKFVLPGGFAIFLGLAIFYAFGPLLIFFEPDAPYPSSSPEKVHRLSALHEPHSLWGSASSTEDVKKEPEDTDCALIIPCYKSESLIAATLESALKVFPAQNIFVVANGNSLTPLDNTEDVCKRYGVSHTWSPMGSKIIAQFVR